MTNIEGIRVCQAEDCQKELIKQQKKYCSRKCARLSYKFPEERKLLYSTKFSGENNPNFGNIWTEEQKLHASNILNERYNGQQGEYYREIAGNSNRGKKFSKELVQRMHDRPRESYVHPKSDDTKKLIGEKSKEKFTPEYNKKIRQTMEERGIWIPKNESNDWHFYKIQTNWIEHMWNRIQLPEDFNEIGIRNNKNTKGYVRDHIFSKSDGYRIKLFPEIIRHPANCRTILNEDNAKKYNKSLLTLEELLSRIENYIEEWIEQELCLDLICLYRQGYRWSIDYE